MRGYVGVEWWVHDRFRIVMVRGRESTVASH